MLLLLTTIVAVLCNAEGFTPQDANEYIDNVLSGKFADEIEYSRLDPYKFPEINIDLISKRIWDNKAQLNKGLLHHVSTVKRINDCSVPHWTSANVTFTCTLGFNKLVLNYTANVTYDNMQLGFYPTTSITGTMITIQVSTSKYENIPSLRLLIVNNAGEMLVTSRMISVGDVSQIVGPPIRDAIVKTGTTGMHKLLNGRFKDALGYSIYRTPVSFV
ncbi:hypothetical protein CDAR_33101 [Caerostris darwini]|uniref:Uncharacterized protein n=1 Tax=Caerostris darwini TaxID=1538125 RepID=A0AAV4SKD5_9ARAC|nr:hypothetical protein CDAR_33101 [Caerostris darwini]